MADTSMTEATGAGVGEQNNWSRKYGIGKWQNLEKPERWAELSLQELYQGIIHIEASVEGDDNWQVVDIPVEALDWLIDTLVLAKEQVAQ